MCGTIIVSRQYMIPLGLKKMNDPSKVLIILGWHGDTVIHLCVHFALWDKMLWFREGPIPQPRIKITDVNMCVHTHK
jgi:hypothetical protein